MHAPVCFKATRLRPTRSEKERYLRLIAFIAHQYYRLHDNLVDVLLTSLQSFQNSAQREHKEQCYLRRERRNESLKTLVGQALKAFGQPLKSLFILRVIDEPVLRMSIEKVLSGIEHVHAFTRAVSVGNPREFLQAEKEDQQMAEACKRLIKNCIICWNYLYLSQTLAEIDDPVKREEFLKAVARGSVAAWEHLNLLGEYDFSEDKLQDSVGIKPPILTD